MQMKKLFDTCGEIIHWPLDDMFVLALDGPMENMTIKMLSFLMDGKFISTSQMEGVRISNPFMSNTQGPNTSMNNYIQTF